MKRIAPDNKRGRDHDAARRQTLVERSAARLRTVPGPLLSIKEELAGRSHVTSWNKAPSKELHNAYTHEASLPGRRAGRSDGRRWPRARSVSRSSEPGAGKTRRRCQFPDTESRAGRAKGGPGSDGAAPECAGATCSDRAAHQRQGPAAVQRAPQTRTVQPRSQPRERAVERSRVQDRANRQTQERRQQLQQRRAQPGPQGPAAKQVEQRPTRPDTAARNGPQVGKRGQGAQPVARVQANDQQRRQLRDGLFRGQNVQRIPRSRLNVPLTVGSHIPRNHRLYRFTPALLALVPMYAAYSYLVVDDTICVVDPETYAVVDVIPSSIEQAGPGPGPPAAGSRSPASRCAASTRACRGTRRAWTCASASLWARKCLAT